MRQRFVLAGDTVMFLAASELSSSMLNLHSNDEVLYLRKMRSYNDLQASIYPVPGAAVQQMNPQERLYRGWYFVEHSGKRGWIAGAAALLAPENTPCYPAPMHSRQRHLQIQIVHTDVSNLQYHATFSLTSHRETWTETKRAFLWDLTRPDAGQTTASAVCPYCGKSFTATVYSIEQMEREAVKRAKRHRIKSVIARIVALLLALCAVTAFLLLEGTTKIAVLLWIIIGLFICLVVDRDKGFILADGPLGARLSVPLMCAHPRPELHHVEHVASRP